MTKNHALLGILWILCNNLVLCAQSTLVKHLTHSMASYQVVFLYKIVVFVIIMCFVFYKGISKVKTTKLPLHLLRASLSISAGLLFTHGLKSLGFINAMAIAYTEPLFATCFAVIIFKERLNIYLFLVILIGFCGSMLVLKPHDINFNYNSLYVLAAAIIWALDNVVIKQLGKTETKVQYLFYVSFFSIIYSAPYGIKTFVAPELVQIPYLIAVALCYCVHLIAVFKAFQYANISVLAPFDFSRLVFSMILGYLTFGEVIEPSMLIGSIIIISSAVYIILYREKQKVIK